MTGSLSGCLSGVGLYCLRETGDMGCKDLYKAYPQLD